MSTLHSLTEQFASAEKTGRWLVCEKWFGGGQIVSRHETEQEAANSMQGWMLRHPRGHRGETCYYVRPEDAMDL